MSDSPPATTTAAPPRRRRWLRRLGCLILLALLWAGLSWFSPLLVETRAKRAALKAYVEHRLRQETTVDLGALEATLRWDGDGEMTLRDLRLGSPSLDARRKHALEVETIRLRAPVWSLGGWIATEPRLTVREAQLWLVWDDFGGFNWGPLGEATPATGALPTLGVFGVRGDRLHWTLQNSRLHWRYHPTGLEATADLAGTAVEDLADGTLRGAFDPTDLVVMQPTARGAVSTTAQIHVDRVAGIRAETGWPYRVTRCRARFEALPLAMLAVLDPELGGLPLDATLAGRFEYGPRVRGLDATMRGLGAAWLGWTKADAIGLRVDWLARPAKSAPDGACEPTTEATVEPTPGASAMPPDAPRMPDRAPGFYLSLQRGEHHWGQLRAPADQAVGEGDLAWLDLDSLPPRRTDASDWLTRGFALKRRWLLAVGRLRLMGLWFDKASLDIRRGSAGGFDIELGGATGAGRIDCTLRGWEHGLLGDAPEPSNGGAESETWSPRPTVAPPLPRALTATIGVRDLAATARVLGPYLPRSLGSMPTQGRGTVRLRYRRPGATEDGTGWRVEAHLADVALPALAGDPLSSALREIPARLTEVETLVRRARDPEAPGATPPMDRLHGLTFRTLAATVEQDEAGRTRLHTLRAVCNELGEITGVGRDGPGGVFHLTLTLRRLAPGLLARNTALGEAARAAVVETARQGGLHVEVVLDGATARVERRYVQDVFRAWTEMSAEGSGP